MDRERVDELLKVLLEQHGSEDFCAACWVHDLEEALDAGDDERTA